MQSGDSFRLLTEEQAGALAGIVLAFCVLVFDWMPRVAEWLSR